MNTKANSKQQENELRGSGAIDTHLAELQAIRGLLTIVATQATRALRDREEKAGVLGDGVTALLAGNEAEWCSALLERHAVKP